MRALPVLAVLLWAAPAFAQGDAFANGPDGAKVHVASGFVCPEKIGPFGRDAVGVRDPETNADFCAYSALDGVYGMVTLMPVTGGFDPRAVLAPDFEVQEETHAKRAGEKTLKLGSPAAPLSVYTRTYDTGASGDLDYRVLFAGAAVGNWAVTVTVEYADPRNRADEKAFVNAIYAAALKRFAPVP